MCSAKGSLLNRYTAGDNGVSTRRAVDIREVGNDVVLSLKTKRGKSQKRPSKMWQSTKLKGGISKAMDTTTEKVNGYWSRKELLAKKRVAQILRAQTRARKIQKKADN